MHFVSGNLHSRMHKLEPVADQGNTPGEGVRRPGPGGSKRARDSQLRIAQRIFNLPTPIRIPPTVFKIERVAFRNCTPRQLVPISF